MNIKLFNSQEEAIEAVPPGTVRKLIVKDKEYLLIHSINGFLVSNYLCPHMKEPLDKSKLNSFNEIICPLHEYRFNLETGTEYSNRCPQLTLYKITIKPDGLYLHF